MDIWDLLLLISRHAFLLPFHEFSCNFKSFDFIKVVYILYAQSFICFHSSKSKSFCLNFGHFDCLKFSFPNNHSIGQLLIGICLWKMKYISENKNLISNSKYTYLRRRIKCKYASKNDYENQNYIRCIPWWISLIIRSHFRRVIFIPDILILIIVDIFWLTANSLILLTHNISLWFKFNYQFGNCSAHFTPQSNVGFEIFFYVSRNSKSQVILVWFSGFLRLAHIELYIFTLPFNLRSIENLNCWILWFDFKVRQRHNLDDFCSFSLSQSQSSLKLLFNINTAC